MVVCADNYGSRINSPIMVVSMLPSRIIAMIMVMAPAVSSVEKTRVTRFAMEPVVIPVVH